MIGSVARVPPRASLLLTIIGFALALALLLSIAELSYRNVIQFQASAQWVDHTYRVIGDLDNLLSTVEAAEAGQRGFLLSGNEQYLESYTRASTAIPDLLRSLRQLTRDYTRQQAAIGPLTELIAHRLDLLEHNVQLKKSGRSVDLTTLQQGGAAMSRVQAQILSMKAEEQRLLAARAAELQSHAASNQRVIVFGNAAAITLLLLAGGLLWRETTKRIRTEEERERFFTLSLDLLGIAGTDGYFKRLNPAFEQTLGYSVDELCTRPFLDFVHPDDHAGTRAEVAKLSKGEPTLAFENRYRCNNGSWKWLSWRVQPYPSEGLLYCTARDVTEHKQGEEKIRALNTYLDARVVQLDATNKELDSFSYSVSHDLRSPLRAINGYAQILEEDYNQRLDDEGRRLLRVVRDNATQMGRLIDDLLAFSRLSRTAVVAATVDMEALAREVAAQLPRDGDSGRVQAQVAPLPLAIGDRGLLRQVWANLLGNAIKYSGKHAAPEVAVSGRIEGDQCIYCVKDNGVGFDMRYYDKLFGVFQRLHSADEFSGTSVGLAIVQRIVMRHGGRVCAESQPDAGASFYFSLPAMVPEHA